MWKRERGKEGGTGKFDKEDGEGKGSKEEERQWE